MGRIHSLIATATGWTAKEIGETEWFRILDLLAYWRDSPPTHVLLSRYPMLGSPRAQSNTGLPPDLEAKARELLTQPG